jgi:hypothetical protein
MHPALLKLIRLQLKGWLRRQFTGGSVRRIIFSVLSIVLLAAWLAGTLIGASARPPRGADAIMATLPFYLTLLGLLPILLGNDDRAIAFSPAEIGFLFPGPFGRRELVLFKMLKMAAGSLAGAVFFSIMLHRYAGGFAYCVAGSALALIFINFSTTVVALIRDMIEERAYALARKLGTLLLVVAVVAVVWLVRQSDKPTTQQMRDLADSTPVRIALAPARVFAHVFAAGTPGEFAGWVAACLAMIAGALLLVLTLDKGYMEAALAASQRRQTRITRMVRGVGTAADKPVRSMQLRGLGVLGPAQAIVRRHLITALRGSRAWMLAVVFALGYGYLISRIMGDKPDSPVLAGMMPALVILLMMLPQTLRFDFRNDLDHLEYLKALPLRARTVALAEIAVPTVILSLLGWAIAGGVAAFVGLPPSILLMVAMAVPPLAVWMIGLENFVFLMVPTRQFAHGQAGMVFGGRRMLLMLARLGLIVVGGGPVGAVSLGVWSATHSMPATYLAGWAALSLIAAAIVLAVAWAYARFDVSTDMPV